MRVVIKVDRPDMQAAVSEARWINEYACRHGKDVARVIWTNKCIDIETDTDYVATLVDNIVEEMPNACG